LSTSLRTIKDSLSRVQEAIDLCFQSQQTLASLILLYAGIDIASSLDQDCAAMKTGKRYRHWCDNYLLRSHALPCTAFELYGARCGLLHGLSAKSDLHAQKGNKEKVRFIYYAWGTGTTAKLEHLFKLSQMSDCVAVQQEELIAAFKSGVSLFLLELETHIEKSTYAVNQASKILGHLSDEMTQDLSTWAESILNGGGYTPPPNFSMD